MAKQTKHGKQGLRSLSLLLVLVFCITSALSLGILPSSAQPASALTDASLRGMRVYPGGMPFGVKFLTEGILLIGFADLQSNGRSVCPGKEAGLRPGDVLLRINGTPLEGAVSLAEIVAENGKAPLSVLVRRDKKELTLTVQPIFSEQEQRYTTGLLVRDSGAGIGTVTFILPKTRAFAGLGHGICDSATGELIPMTRGSVVGVTIRGVVRGLPGSPGEVKGYFSSGKTGTLLGNSACGVWGVFAALPDKLPTSAPIAIGLRGEVKEGPAFIYSMLDSDSPQRYEISISDIQIDSLSNKCFTVKVTDGRLIEKTGGIIQGMSGSPIIQNGKLIGAVTHVLINDPTTGYGIFVDNMLREMGSLAS